MLISGFFLYLVGNVGTHRGGIYSYGLKGILCKHLCLRVVRRKSCAAQPVECKQHYPDPIFLMSGKCFE